MPAPTIVSVSPAFATPDVRPTTADPQPIATRTPPATSAPTPAPTPTLVVPTRTLSLAERLEVFEAAWRFTRDYYAYPDFLGVNWAAVREEFLPRVGAATSTIQFYGVMRAMVARLPDGHSAFRDPPDTQWATLVRIGAAGASVTAVAAGTLWTPDGNLVVHAYPGFAAARDGLRSGDLIVAVDGAFPTGSQRWNGLPGPAGPVRLTVRRPDGSTHVIRTRREPISSDAIPPAVYASRLAGSATGMLTIYTFRQRDLARHARSALEALLADGPLDGLIVDVRPNYGGLIDAMRETLALFIDGGVAGRMEGRLSPYDIGIPAGASLPQLRNVPIAVLVSEHTNSAGEMFAAAMRARGRARVVGAPSKGNTENIVYQTLPHGSSLVLSVRLFRLPDGTSIEGTGVTLDERVEAKWWRFPPEADPQIVAARALMRRSAAP